MIAFLSPYDTHNNLLKYSTASLSRQNKHSTCAHCSTFTTLHHSVSFWFFLFLDSSWCPVFCRTQCHTFSRNYYYVVSVLWNTIFEQFRTQFPFYLSCCMLFLWPLQLHTVSHAVGMPFSSAFNSTISCCRLGF